MAGFASRELASSAKGKLHFEWKKGGVTGRIGATADAPPPVLARFDSWTADAEIANHAVTLGENEARQGARSGSAKAAISFGEPPVVIFGTPKPPTAQQK
jgi:hypothetical protein